LKNNKKDKKDITAGLRRQGRSMTRWQDIKKWTELTGDCLPR